MNIIQRSCASSVNKKRKSLKMNALPYCFTYLPEFLEPEHSFYQRHWKLERIRLSNSLFIASKGGECFKSTPDYKWLPSKIWHKYPEFGLKNMEQGSSSQRGEMTFQTLPETAGVQWSKALSLSHSHKMLSDQTRNKKLDRFNNHT